MMCRRYCKEVHLLWTVDYVVNLYQTMNISCNYRHKTNLTIMTTQTIEDAFFFFSHSILIVCWH